MRTIGFVLVLLGIVTIYLAVQSKLGAAVTALLTGVVPNGNPIGQAALNAAGTISDTATQQNIQKVIKNNKKLTPAQKKIYSDELNPFSPSHGGALGG